MKKRREHVVTLSDRAIEILRELPRVSEWIFPSPKTKKSNQPCVSAVPLQFLQDVMGVKATVHGMRSTFKIWTLEQTRFEDHVVEGCLAHAVGNIARRAYARTDMLDKRRKVMDAWADYLSAVPTEKVVPLRR